ncbi:hypothetical protein PG990_000964 [Apiospora arundinis]
MTATSRSVESSRSVAMATLTSTLSASPITTTEDIIITSSISSSTTSATTSSSSGEDKSSSTATASDITISASSVSSMIATIATFGLRGPNSARSDANDQTLEYSETSGESLYVGPPSDSADYSIGEFSLEADTNRLMVSPGYYVVTTTSRVLYAVYPTIQDGSPLRPMDVYVHCVPPVRRGQTLDCTVDAELVHPQFRVGARPGSDLILYLLDPTFVNRTTTIDLIVT